MVYRADGGALVLNALATRFLRRFSSAHFEVQRFGFAMLQTFVSS